MAFFANFACHTLICSDVSKNRVRLVAQNGRVWQETTNPAYSPVLRKPNEFQNRIQFFENWVNSKLSRGNTYVLKRRDGRGVVVALYVLNPDRVQPLVSDDGQVFYRLSRTISRGWKRRRRDRAGARDHPRPLQLPVPPAGRHLAALRCGSGGDAGHEHSARDRRLAANGVRPGGILTAPGKIDPDNAKRLKETWETQYGGAAGAAKIAILGDGLKFESLTMKADDAQLIEQLKFTAEMICSVYHVPPYKIGVGPLPSYNNVQALNVEYFSQCLQKHIEDIELCLDEGLGIGEGVSRSTARSTAPSSTSTTCSAWTARRRWTCSTRARTTSRPDEGARSFGLGRRRAAIRRLSAAAGF
jgi:phage portal protein BeeE